MSSGQKVSISFLTALILFVGFVFFANPRIFGIKKEGFQTFIETRFYKQSIISEKQAALDKLSEYTNSYISNILNKIALNDDAFLKDKSVKTFISKEKPTRSDIDKRNNRVNQLGIDFPEIQIRIIDNNKSNKSDNTSNRHDLYYSSEGFGDYIEKNWEEGLLKNYDEIQNELSPDLIIADGNTKGDRPLYKFLLDSEKNRFIISFPFYRYENICDATLVCYFDIGQLIQYLVDNDALSIGQSFDVIAGTDLENISEKSKYTGGFVTGIPHDINHKNESIGEFSKPVFDSWNKNPSANLERIIDGDNFTWLLSSASIGNNLIEPAFNISAVYKSSDFELSHGLIIVIYLTVFITLLLICFLIFSIRRDYVTVIRSRIKKVQLGIIKEYLDNHDKVEWNAVALQIAARKDDLNEEIKKSIGIKNSKSRKAKKYSELTNTLLEASWDEILTVIGGKVEKNSESLSGATIDEIRRVLEEVLQSTELNVNVAKMSKAQIADINISSELPVEDIESIEEIDDVDEIEEVEEIDEIADVDDVDEVDDIDEVDEVDQAVDIDDAEIETVETESEVVEEKETVESVEIVDESETEEEAERIDETELVDDVEDNIDLKGTDLETTEFNSEQKGTDLESKSTPIEEVEDLDEEIEPVVPAVYIPRIIEFDTSAVISGFETFCSSKDFNFASVDTVFAEDLCIGDEYVFSNSGKSLNNFAFTTYSLNYNPADFDEEFDTEEGTDLDTSIDTSIKGTDLSSQISSNSSSVLLSESEDLTTSEIQSDENDLPEINEVDSVQDVLAELRGEVIEKPVKIEKIADGIEELPEVIVAPVANTIMKEKSNAGSTRTLFTMTTANSFGISQEIGELEDASDEFTDEDFDFDAKSDSEGLSPVTPTVNSEGLSTVVSPVSSQELSPLTEDESVEEVDELSDAEPINELDTDMPEKLTKENLEADTIIENEGIYSISKNLSFNTVEIDQSFKDLVDSVLR